MNILGMGPLELVVILGLALVVFGPDKLPEIAQQVGRAVREIKRMTSEVTDEFQKSIDPDRPSAQRTPTDSVTRPPTSTAPPPPTLPTPAAPVTRPTASRGTEIEPPY